MFALDADARGAVSMVAGHAPLAQGGLHGAGYDKIGRHVREHCVGNHSKKNSVAPANKPTNRFKFQGSSLENPALAGQILADFVRKHRA